MSSCCQEVSKLRPHFNEILEWPKHCDVSGIRGNSLYVVGSYSGNSIL